MTTVTAKQRTDTSAHTTPGTVASRFATTTMVFDVILPALRDLGVLTDVVEISAGVLRITLTLGEDAPGDDAATTAAAPPTFSTMSPAEAVALWRLAGGLHAV